MLHDLKQRFRFWSEDMPWQQGVRVWIICIAVCVGMSLATAGLSQTLLPAQAFTWNINPLSAQFLIGFVVAMFLDGGALFEENGWRGFALPRLLKRYDALSASVILGLMWALWHMPVKFDLALTYGFTNFLIMFAILTIKFVLLTIIITYFWNKVGQTTIIAIAMHGLSNDSVRLGGIVLSESFSIQLQYEINLLLPMLVVAGFLVVITKGQLGQESDVPAISQQPSYA